MKFWWRISYVFPFLLFAPVKKLAKRGSLNKENNVTLFFNEHISHVYFAFVVISRAALANFGGEAKVWLMGESSYDFVSWPAALEQVHALIVAKLSKVIDECIRVKNPE